jgi:O-antigen ligase
MIFLSTGYSIQLSTEAITIIYSVIDRNRRELEYMLVQVLLMVFWIQAATTACSLTGSAASIACISMICTLFLLLRSTYTVQVRPKKFIFQILSPVLVSILPASAMYAISVIFSETGKVRLITALDFLPFKQKRG